MNISSVYSFSTNAPGLLGTQIRNAKLMSVLDFDTAMVFEDVATKYRQIYPQLPAGTPDAPNSCVYYLFKGESGERFVLADQWINEATIELIDSVVLQIVVSGATVQDIARVRDALTMIGLKQFSINQITSG